MFWPAPACRWVFDETWVSILETDPQHHMGVQDPCHLTGSNEDMLRFWMLQIRIECHISNFSLSFPRTGRLMPGRRRVFGLQDGSYLWEHLLYRINADDTGKYLKWIGRIECTVTVHKKTHLHLEMLFELMSNSGTAFYFQSENVQTLKTNKQIKLL